MRPFDALKVRSLPEILRKNADKAGDKTALIYMDRSISYGELWRLVSAFGEFVRTNTRERDRVAIWMPNIPQFVVAYYGTLLAGRIAVPVNFSTIAGELKTKPVKHIKITREIESQLTDSRPSVIIAADLFYPILKQVNIDWSCKVVTTGIHEYFPFLLRLLYPLKAWKDGKWVWVPRTVTRLKRILKSGASHPSTYPDTGRTAQLQYTGGTTGVPKGAVLTHHSLASNVFQSIQALEDKLESEKEVVMAALPLFHVYGLTACMNITLLGLRGTLMLEPAFDPGTIIKHMAKYGVTVFPGVNRMYQALLARKKELAKADLSSLKLCLSGAGPVDKDIIDAFSEMTGAVVVEGYGLSETSPVLSVARPEDMHKKKPGVNLLGRPVPGTRMKIIGEDGQDLPVGETGEIAATGPQIMAGYYNKPEDTAAVFSGGWFLTGDIGHTDGECFYLTDRKKDMIKVVGEQVSPSHIEQALQRHPSVKEAYVVGVPHSKRGETPIACAALKPDAAASEQDLLGFLRSQSDITQLDLPSRALVFDTFDPYKNMIGKLLKRKLKEEVLKQLK